MNVKLNLREPRSLPRVVVNPNRATRRNPAWTVVGLEELGDVSVAVGERVVAVQPYDDGDLVSVATVAQIDTDSELVFLDVDWAGFSAPPAVWNERSMNVNVLRRPAPSGWLPTRAASSGSLESVTFTARPAA